MQIRAGLIWASTLVSIGTLSAVVACVHKDDTTDSNTDNSPQPTEDQLMQIADDMATHAPHANDPGDNGELSVQGDDGGAVAINGDDSGAPDNTASTGNEVGQGPVPPLPVGWQSVTLAPCGITLNFPGAATEDDNKGDPAHQFKFRVPGATDAAFSVSCTDFPNGTSDANGWLDAARDKLDGNGGKLEKETPMTLGGNPGREVVVDLPGAAGHETARAFLLKNRSIVALVGGAEGAIPAGNVSAFLDSIRLTQ